ncbi:hypothetical protein G7B40_006165 [Aetokthonos hydrillicola Thurmond2011]|uniref:Uncharacterized protein n=1 Tax=Aetokthonos hydrillicola Thurmond2011 TaxID=2712845 RepID=A0AAP5M3U0_9CYAN|nr:hypothetical protein [Aetokthonos hydrillicola]MBO3462218.1 hypothetical protein [Aetokthonos hydrillicola CCALA 1050]MBW4585084.1 hypothetical protein [Aetokthonos hydrillicola CCALA 1050]MDR9894156.1 hypothetical protein [Aetokthonos hydrillicola Thurmond2011]
MLVNKIVNFKNILISNPNKALLILFLIESFSYFTIGHFLIESAYKGEAVSILNSFVKGRYENSLDFYFKRGDMFYLIFNILVYSFIYSSSFIFKTFRDRQQILISFKTKTAPDWLSIVKSKEIVSSFILFLIFYGLYLYFGFLLIHQHDKMDFFGGDLWKAGRYWTTFSAQKPFYFKGSHPLFLLFVCPWGTLINSLIKSPEITVLILNSFFGAFAVFLTSIFFNKLIEKPTQALLISTVFGLTMSQLVFSTVPETYALAGCSIITTYILFFNFIENKKLDIGYWILAGIFTFGVTITNFIQTLVCFTIAVLALKTNKNKVSLISEYIGTVVTLAFVLSIFQKIIIIHAPYFFLPDMLTTETKYIKSFLFSQPLTVIQELLKHFFLVNFVSSSPFNTLHPENGSAIELTFFMRNLDYSLIGAIGTIIWILLLILGVYKNILSAHKNIVVLALCGNLLFNLTLYSIFGVNEMFLYTCNFTFIVLALATNQSLLNKLYIRVGLISLIILMLINNLTIVKAIASV